MRWPTGEILDPPDPDAMVSALTATTFARDASECNAHRTALAKAVDVLNEALAADPQAINALMRLSVQCNATLARHPSVQVGAHQHDFELRPLGLINGLFGVDEHDWGFIYMHTAHDDGRITHFSLSPEAGESST